MLGSSDLANYVEEHGIEAQVITLPVETPTVERAARAVGTSPDRIVKSLLFLVDDEPVIAIACGEARIDRRSIAAQYGVGRKRVRLADAETVLKLTGYPIGAMPPFGHRRAIRTLIDWRVLEQPEVYAGGGSIAALMRVPAAEILRLTSATVLDLIDPASGGEA